MKAILVILLVVLSTSVFAEKLQIKLKIPSHYKLTKSSRLKVVLYGYDRYLADASASKLNATYVKVTKNNMRVDIPVRPSAYMDIDQGMGQVPSKNAKFYANIVLDLDGDGKICSGDLMQDFEISNTKFFNSFPSPLLKVPMTEIERGNWCSNHF